MIGLLAVGLIRRYKSDLCDVVFVNFYQKGPGNECGYPSTILFTRRTKS
ncbi:MAG: hypothetical protein WBK54_01085 [Bacilli bacterium]|jgi:hypothetical protein|nr:hypothetical protein [Acholeplasmataceae bacterium]